MTGAVVITLAGVPVAKGRPKFAKRGKFMQAYTPAKTRTYEAALKAEAVSAMCGRAMFTGAVRLYVEATFPIAKSWPKRTREAAAQNVIFPVGRPDADNIGKCAGDSLNGVVFKDDAQVIELTVRKRFGEPALVLTVSEI